MTQTPVDIDLQDKRLVICSNREPYKVKPTESGYEFEATVGGLVSALIPIMRATQGLWVSWAGGGDLDKSELPTTQAIPAEEPKFTQRRVFLTEKEVNNYYYGFANQALWPLCHYFLEHARFLQEHWEAYRSVNAKFAQAILDEVDIENDLLWLQDYHMALVAGMIK
ncbi:MAG: trehalose-6-phosphate synthase, partial [Candidatus Marinimicrobia bacterium]|nr:trehalose-6-phosphate synthase [Candidatus Neomarinimicrobiota bacterium]